MINTNLFILVTICPVGCAWILSGPPFYPPKRGFQDPKIRETLVRKLGKS
jgi:hypothetical protein